MIDSYLHQIRLSYPDLAIAHARLLGSGQFSDVLLVNDALIFRFPKSPHVAEEMAREIPILRALRGKPPLPIPDVLYASEAQPGQLVFMGYPLIPGRPLLRAAFAAIHDDAVLEQIASELADFLRALHRLQPGALGLSLEADDSRAHWQTMYADFRDKLFPFMRRDAQAQVSASFEAALSNPAFWQFEPVLCHGDFGTGNILYADGHITGIIDFTFCGLGDPAQEVGALFASYGAAFVERVLQFYPALRPALPRARFIMSNYALMQALYALRDGNREDFDDGMRDYV